MNVSVRTLLAIGVAGVALVDGASAGTKDDVRDLQARMQRAEQALAAAANTTLRLNELEREVQLLTGQIEELNFTVRQQNSRINAMAAALAGESGEAFAPFAPDGLSGPAALTNPFASPPEQLAPEAPGASVDPVDPAVLEPAVTLPADPDRAFTYASGLLLAGDYPKAKAAFRSYVTTFPEHPNAADARFRLGEIHLAQGENADAADVFLKHIEAYPNNPRAAEAYLKLGTAMARMDNGAQACSVFAALGQKFPNAPDSVKDRMAVEVAELRCQ